ncbi:MAG: hypothetical protein ACUVQQ_03835 [Thermogutta sp.]
MLPQWLVMDSKKWSFHEELRKWEGMMEGSESLQADGTATVKRPPGTCFPWEEKVKDLPPIQGDAELVQRVWRNIDALGYMYIWQVLLSF